jgi:hypothetical protein
MGPTHGLQPRAIACAITCVLLLQTLSYAQQVQPSQSAGEGITERLPDSPGTVQAQLNEPRQNAPEAPAPANQTAPQAAPSTQENTGGSGNAQSSTSTQPPQQPTREPLGTAAAESIPTSGVAASRPAGAAVAPAKQRRIRSILIKTGALVGIGVAVGTTVALSQGSPSRPPGAK